jgi:hypothetical protein
MFLVVITASKSGMKTYSDSQGNFSLSCSEKDKLIFDANGFDRKKLKTVKCNQATIDLVYSNDESSFKDATMNNHVKESILASAIEITLK